MAENPKAVEDQPKPSVHDFADKDGKFRRQTSQFRNWLSADSEAEFPAEKDRYV